MLKQKFCLFIKFNKIFSNLGIDIILLRQAYDYYSNMVGKENGTQDKFWPKSRSILFLYFVQYIVCVLLRDMVRIIRTAMIFIGIQRV